MFLHTQWLHPMHFLNIQHRVSNFSEPLAAHYFTQASLAVIYLHKRGVYHRDIKPENCNLDEHFNLKLTDFGTNKVRTCMHGFGGLLWGSENGESGRGSGKRERERERERKRMRSPALCSKMPMQLLVAKKPYNNITIMYYAFLHAYIVCVHCTALSDHVYVVFLYGAPAHL